MFETIDDPEETLRVPGWLWDLCVRLYRSRDAGLRAAATGLLVNRVIPDDEDCSQRSRFEEKFEAWADALSEAELDDLERALGVEVCRMREWLSRLARDGFPEGDLIAFGCAREILQAAVCALEWRDREEWICEDLGRLDQAVVKTLEVHLNPVGAPKRLLVIRQKSALLDRARRCDDMTWWTLLTTEDPP
ncbi:MAG: hypothetical protein NUW08_00505 [Candidatus Uhrbacteria bacterium]|nr:hypothetical protein [Candidatus Uhrbacteria bacterium]